MTTTSHRIRKHRLNICYLVGPNKTQSIQSDASQNEYDVLSLIYTLLSVVSASGYATLVDVLRSPYWFNCYLPSADLIKLAFSNCDRSQINAVCMRQKTRPLIASTLRDTLGICQTATHLILKYKQKVQPENIHINCFEANMSLKNTFTHLIVSSTTFSSRRSH